MTLSSPQLAAIRQAAHVDRDDPFVAQRLASRARTSVGIDLDYSRVRRLRAPIVERFRLVKHSKSN